jgi:hypothetical protein
MSYTCSICGKIHTDLHIGFAAPFQWADRLAKDPNSLLTKNLCIIEGRDFFVRGVIEIPVHDYEHEFGWGVWVSHKKKNFETYRQNFDRRSIGPFFGSLCTEINYYPETTLHLKTMAHYRGQGLCPSIVLDEADHLLYRHQRDGISLSEAWRIVHEHRQWNAEIARKRELDDLRAKAGQKPPVGDAVDCTLYLDDADIAEQRRAHLRAAKLQQDGMPD